MADQDDRFPVLCLLGPSGAGKSHFAAATAARERWLSLSLDQWPLDGRVASGLTGPVEALMRNGDARPLVGELRRRAAEPGLRGAVLDFPSGALLPARHALAAQAHGVRVAYLVGPARACLDAFLARERANGRGLDAEHWRANNERLLAALLHPSLAPWRIDAFAADGRRLDDSSVIERLLAQPVALGAPM